MTFNLKPDGYGAFHCDTCPDHIETDHVAEFATSLDEVRAKGWRVYKGPDKMWAHACPACVVSFAETKR